MDKYSGKKLDGRYEIHELIGVGGMAYVYRCTDIIDDREVAVKILKDEFLNNEEFIRRFKNESKAIAMLSHPNIVKVYDVSFGDMIQYIVMEYIDGITLKEYIGQQGVLDWREALHLTTQILKALQHAHNKGVVHRDIKPHNIMLLQDGTIKVTDFGIARLTDTQTKTMTEQAIGSVHYIAPEQARGSKTDGKSDIYSVGVMLYEMITGKLPFDADSAVSVALMQLQSTPRMPREINPEIPAGLEQITMHAMQKNPVQRYQTALDMLGDLERFRLNPNVRFDYKYFVDSDPTRYVNKYQKNELKSEDDGDEAEEIEEKKEHGSAYYAIKTAIITAVILIAFFLGASIIRGCVSDQSTDVEINNFVGMTIVEANEKNPNNFKFEIKSSPKFDSKKKTGEIVKQSPKAGSKLVKSGATIELTVNSKDVEASVPFCKNLSKKEAAQLIKDKSFTPKFIDVYDSLGAADAVVDTFPPAGVQATVGSTVYVYIVRSGLKESKVEVPEVTDKPLSEAQGDLSESKLECKYTYDDESTAPEGTVIGQSPLQYSKVDEGTIVNLIVSSGKGSQSTVNITIDMPKNVDYNVKMSVSIDGVIDSDYTKTINPKYNTSYAISFTGSGTETVLIMLDGQNYRKYSIDFSTVSYTAESYDFIPTEPATTAAPTTPPETQAPPETEYVTENAQAENGDV